MELTEIIEALLFATQEPLSTKEMVRAIKTTVADREGELYEGFKKIGETTVAEAVQSLIKTYEETGRAFTLVERPTGWRLYARPAYAEWIRSLMPGKKGSRLSPPALETLAIIAYRQPLTKAHVESVRGVAVDGVLQTLLDRNLVRIGGRADLPGRPLLYETSELFLEYFGIKDLDDLPNSAELRRAALEETAADADDAPKEEQLSMAALEKPGKEKAEKDKDEGVQSGTAGEDVGEGQGESEPEEQAVENEAATDQVSTSEDPEDADVQDETESETEEPAEDEAAEEHDSTSEDESAPESPPEAEVPKSELPKTEH